MGEQKEEASQEVINFAYKSHSIFSRVDARHRKGELHKVGQKTATVSSSRFENYVNQRFFSDPCA